MKTIINLIIVFIISLNSVSADNFIYNDSWVLPNKAYDFQYIKWDDFTYINNKLKLLSYDTLRSLHDKIRDNKNNVYKELNLMVLDLVNNNSISIYTDVKYWDNLLNTADVYLTNKESSDTIFFIHWWGWKLGSKNEDIHTIKWKYFSEKGINFININYTLFPNADYKEQVLEITTAIEYFNENLELNWNKFLMWHSAWGHLALLTWMNAGSLNNNQLSNDYFSWIFSLDSGWLDIPYIKNNNKLQFNIIYKDVFWTNLKELIKASPHYYIWSTNPDIYLFFSDQRGDSQDEMQNNFYNKSKKLGNTIIKYQYNYSHSDFNTKVWIENEIITEDIIDIIEKKEEN